MEEEKDLDTLFQKAYEKVSNMKTTLPPDVMLRIYAYYKQATYGTLQGKQKKMLI